MTMTRATSRRDVEASGGRERLRVVKGGLEGEGAPRAARGEGSARTRRLEEDPRVRRRRRLMTAFLLMACAVIVALFLRGPITRLVESRRNLAETEARLAEEEERTRSLEERRERDLTDRYVEMEARRMGYVKPGEIPIVILDTSEGDAPGQERESAGSATMPEGVSPPSP